ncbi:MAG: type II/IV secretion system protein, partial [Thermoguttaceae bacterium]|nr:type II/IV secretion system protein [Thermoguttaceae bacterium]
GAYTRMIDMGIEPFLVATSVEGIMAQRLVRRLCRHCRQAYVPRPEDVPPDFPLQRVLDEKIEIFRPVGCRACRMTGYSGRAALYELLIPTDEVRQKAGAKAPSNDIKKIARAAGMQTLRDNGWKKVLSGMTSVEEVIRTAKAD